MKLALSLVLVAVILAGAAARLHRLPTYVPDSGDEWGNTLAPLNILVDRGDPGTFFHPALYYEVTALAYAGAYGVARASGALDATASPADLLVHDARWYRYTARAVSAAAALAALVAVAALATSLWSPLAGLFAAALLAVLPLHAAYSLAVRVDSFFLPLLLVAFLQLTRLLAPRPQRDWNCAGLLIGLAAGANYPGALLVAWLVVARWLQPPAPAGHPAPRLWRPLALAALAFLVTNPYVLVHPHSFVQHLAFLSGMSVTAHPGRETQGPFFYLELLGGSAPLLAGLGVLGALAIAVTGTRRERFVLSLPVVWLLGFSLAQSKFDRFVLPAAALGCVVAAGLPFVLARRLAAHRRLAPLVAGAAGVALLAAIAVLLPRVLPLPLHPMLPPADAPVLAWLETHAPPDATVLVERGLVPLLDVATGEGRLASAVRESLRRVRPGLAQRYVPMAYVGGLVNATPDALDAERVDYVVLSPRTMRYAARACDRLPEVCAFHRAVQTRGVFQYEPDEGIEPAYIYRIERGR